ncbi:MAG: GtrA family protein [Candidatus Magasanikbacteria bacterium]|nr:GtrA family protein [Candidatus Magasanikbacteria bacterium]
MEHNRDISFTKSDFWLSIIAGEAIAVLAIPVLKNVKILGMLTGSNHNLIIIFLVSWFVSLPIATAGGLYLVWYLAGLRWPSLFQIAKYGIIGWMNVFLSAGILNFFIWLTGVASGWMVDVFIAISFITTMTYSFFWNKLWTFHAGGALSRGAEYIKFFGVSGAVASLNLFLLHLLINTIGAPAGLDEKIWANIAFFGLIPASFLGNFFGYKLLVFSRIAAE